MISLTVTSQVHICPYHPITRQKILHTTTSFEKYLMPTSLESLGPCNTTTEEIIHLDSTIRISHVTGVADISPAIAVSSLASIAYPLSDINCSFTTNAPNALKIAKASGTNFQKEDRYEVSNYITMRCFHFSLLFLEKAMYERLNTYITKADILFPSKPTMDFNLVYAIINPQWVLAKKLRSRSLGWKLHPYLFHI